MVAGRIPEMVSGIGLTTRRNEGRRQEEKSERKKERKKARQG